MVNQVPEEEDEGEIDISVGIFSFIKAVFSLFICHFSMIFNLFHFQVRNVVCNYTLPFHIDLRRVALNSSNVQLDPGRGVGC